MLRSSRRGCARTPALEPVTSFVSPAGQSAHAQSLSFEVVVLHAVNKIPKQTVCVFPGVATHWSVGKGYSGNVRVNTRRDRCVRVEGRAR